MAAYSNDRRVPDARVEDWMEVVQSQDPASMAVEASVDSPLAMKSVSMISLLSELEKLTKLLLPRQLKSGWFVYKI